MAVDVGEILASAEGVVAQFLDACRERYLHEHGAVAEAFRSDIAQCRWEFKRSEVRATHEQVAAKRIYMQLQVERGDEHVADERRQTVGGGESPHCVVDALVAYCGRNGDVASVHVAV